MLKSAISDQFIVLSDAGSFTGADLNLLLRQKIFQSLEGKNVALHCHPSNLVKYVLGLDGIANSVLLAPHDACEIFIQRTTENLNLDFVLTDETVNSHHWKIEVKEFQDFLTFAEPISKECGPELETQWLVATSGTTGTPKIVAHTVDSLTRTASKTKEEQNLAWGLLYDPARFAGFQVILQAVMSNTTLIIPSPNLDFERKIEYFVSNGCTALSATPTLWRKILMTKSARRLRLEQITLGGEIVDQRIINALALRFPKAKITHIFASTEAGVGFSVKDRKAGFPLSWLESDIRGVKLKISPEGTLCLKNTYLNQAYIGDAGRIADLEGWIDTGDVLEIENDRLLFKGRLNGSINIGGNKVIPEDIEAKILEVPGVFQAVVRAKSSSIAGSLLEALIVPDPSLDDTSALKKAVKNYCREMLPAFKVPAFINLVDELPIGPAGKIKR